jgi:hypothetical protein
MNVNLEREIQIICLFTVEAQRMYYPIKTVKCVVKAELKK